MYRRKYVRCGAVVLLGVLCVIAGYWHYLQTNPQRMLAQLRLSQLLEQIKEADEIRIRFDYGGFHRSDDVVIHTKDEVAEVLRELQRATPLTRTRLKVYPGPISSSEIWNITWFQSERKLGTCNLFAQEIVYFNEPDEPAIRLSSHRIAAMITDKVKIIYWSDENSGGGHQ